MRVNVTSSVKIYDLTAEKRFPQWIERAAKANKKDAEWSERINLIQGLSFPNIAEHVAFSDDGNWLVATGIYPPQTRLIDLQNLTTKVQRNLESQVVASAPISGEWTKQVYLLADRSLVFHGRQGALATARVPRAGRCLVYDPSTAEVLVGGASPEVWRYSCEFGSWMRPWAAEGGAVTALAVSRVHGLVTAGTDVGSVCCYDPSSGKQIARLDVAAAVLALPKLDAEERAAAAAAPGVTSIAHAPDGLHLVVGVETGHVLVFDLRSSEPVAHRSHMYGKPVCGLEWHHAEQAGQASDRIISADEHAVRIWDAFTGKQLTVIEPRSPVRGLAAAPGSGLILVPTESPQTNIFFIPALGPAPGWCAFLDSITSELEEKRAAGEDVAFDGYVFCTEADLDRGDLRRLVGTAAVRPVLHGYYVKTEVYRASGAAESFESWAEAKAKAKAEARKAERISVRRAPALAAGAAEDDAEYEYEEEEAAPEAAADPRFAELFGGAAEIALEPAQAQAPAPEAESESEMWSEISDEEGL